MVCRCLLVGLKACNGGASNLLVYRFLFISPSRHLFLSCRYTSPSDAADIYELQSHKSMGFNFIRTLQA